MPSIRSQSSRFTLPLHGSIAITPHPVDPGKCVQECVVDIAAEGIGTLAHVLSKIKVAGLNVRTGHYSPRKVVEGDVVVSILFSEFSSMFAPIPIALSTALRVSLRPLLMAFRSIIEADTGP